MLKILVLIAFSICFAMSKDMPIQQKLELRIPLKQSYVLEFPFKIEVKKTPFYAIKTQEKKEIIPKIVKPDIDGNVQVSVDKKPEEPKSFTMSSSENIIEFFARKEGYTEVIVWGYTEYPIMINVVTVENLEVEDRYLRFIDYKTDVKKAKEYESGSHEKVLVRLLKSLHDDKIPTGFKLGVETMSYENDGLYYQLDKRITGYDYVAEKWVIQNQGKEQISLYEEMFAEKDVYMVSIENTKIKEGEATRLFIIRGMK
jgi:hypothetical protein